MSKEQLAGLVEKWRGEAEEHTLLIIKAILRNKANELDAILATMTEPGVVSDEAHCATCTCVPDMTPAVRFDASPAEREGAVREHLISMGWTPPGAAAPAGEVGFKAWLVEQMPTGTVIGNPEWWAERIARAYELNIPQPTPPAQGKDAEVLRSALEEVVRQMPSQAGPAWIAKDIAQAALAAAAKGVGND